MDLNTPLDAGGSNLNAIITDNGGVLELEIAPPGTTPTHRIVPIATWKRIFDDYIERGQLALRRGIEIDKLNRKIARLEAR